MITGTGTILDVRTGQVLGSAQRIEIGLACDARPMIAGLQALQAAMTIAAQELGSWSRAIFRSERLATLRAQAHRKGRPGWRSIRIPKPPRYTLVRGDNVQLKVDGKVLEDLVRPTTDRIANVARMQLGLDRSADPFAQRQNTPDEGTSPPAAR